MSRLTSGRQFIRHCLECLSRGFAKGRKGPVATAAAASQTGQNDVAAEATAGSGQQQAAKAGSESWGSESETLNEVLQAFDAGVNAVSKAWSTGALLPKVNPDRVTALLDAMKARDAQSLADLVVTIAAPEMAVSPTAITTGSADPTRQAFVRGVMRAVLEAVLDVQLAYDSKAFSGQAVVDRLRTWVADPHWRQQPGPATADAAQLAQAVEVLGLISRDLDVMGDTQADAHEGPRLRVGMVGPVAVGMKLAAVIQRTPPAVMNLAVAGQDLAHALEADAPAVAGEQGAKRG